MESKLEPVQELSLEHLECVSGGGMLDDILQAITSALRSGSETEVPANNASTGIRG